jgi:DNA-binding NarL/FixJ family response regulator
VRAASASASHDALRDGHVPAADLASAVPRPTTATKRAEGAMHEREANPVVNHPPTTTDDSKLWRVVLVDDHHLFRDGMVRLFAYEDDFEVVAQASSGEEAIERVRDAVPDIVLMDIDMPGIGGIEAIRAIAREMPAVTIVALTVHEDDDTLFEAVKAGAQGYLVKSIRSAELLALLRGVAHGEAPLTRGMATRILREFARDRLRSELGDHSPGAGIPAIPAPVTPGIDPAAAFASLSSREEEVLTLVAARMTNKEIAQRLVLSEFTVKNHLRNILAKLHLTSRTQAARLLASLPGRPESSLSRVPNGDGDGGERR